MTFFTQYLQLNIDAVIPSDAGRESPSTTGIAFKLSPNVVPPAEWGISNRELWSIALSHDIVVRTPDDGEPVGLTELH